MNRFDLTANSGLEQFAIRECKQKVNVKGLEHRDGHLYLETDDPFEKIMQLKSIDNIFCVIYDENIPSLSSIGESALPELFQSIINKSDWKNGIRIWAQSHEFYDKQVISEEMQRQIVDTNPIESKLDSLTLNDSSVSNDASPSVFKPTFRCSCNRNGKHSFGSPSVASNFGAILNDHFHWKVSLTNYQLKVQITVINTRLLVSIQLTREALFKRYIVDFGRTTLRGTIAYALLQAADPRLGDIVCDPMCGTGVIPIEAASDWKTIVALGSDINEKANQKSANNFAANPLGNLNFLQNDATNLPYRDASIDVFVTDLPFGRRMGSKTENETLYPAVLKEMLRCLRLNSGRVVLLTQDKRNANALFDPEKGLKQYFFVMKCQFVKVGGLESSIYCLRRNDKPWGNDKETGSGDKRAVADMEDGSGDKEDGSGDKRTVADMEDGRGDKKVVVA